MFAVGPSPRPRSGLSLRWRITLPYLGLAVMLGVGAVYLLRRQSGVNEQARFLRQLADSGQQAVDAVVREETDLLNVERLVANTEGVWEATARGDAEDLRARVLPLVVSTGVDDVAVLDSQGTSLLTVRRRVGETAAAYDALRSESFYAEWPFVGRILGGVTDEGVGDKHAGLEIIRNGEQELPVIFVGGPLKDAGGTVVGAVLAGEYLDHFAGVLSQRSAASVSVYDRFSGRLLGSSLEPQDPAALALSADTLASALTAPPSGSPLRPISVSGSEYMEVLAPLVVRQGRETLGILGVALLRAPVAAASGQDVLGGVWLGAVAVALAGVLGLLIAGSIARPLRVMAEAANRASDGDLEAFVPEGGGDEIGMLGRSFNRLLDGLRHKTLGSRLGRESPAPAAPTEPRLGAASRPEAPAASRLEVDAGSPPGPPGAAPETAEAFAPQRVQAALLYAEVRDEGVAAENAEPRALLETIKQYVSAAEAIVAKHGGELIRFEGGVLVACFGVRPRPLPSPVSALQATHAGVTLIDLFRSLNQRRHAAGQRKLAVSIGVTSGTAVAGTVQAAGRSQLALLGEVTLIARRVQQVAREFGESGLLIDEATFEHLGGAQRQFSLGRYGRVQPGAGEKTLTVYEVKGRTAQLVDPAKPV